MELILIYGFHTTSVNSQLLHQSQNIFHQLIQTKYVSYEIAIMVEFNNDRLFFKEWEGWGVLLVQILVTPHPTPELK